MDAQTITFRFLFVALGAIDRLGGDIVVGMFGGDVGMATGAGIGAVNRGHQFGHINVQGYFSSGGVGRRQSFVGMAIEAGTVFDFCSD